MNKLLGPRGRMSRRMWLLGAGQCLLLLLPAQRLYRLQVTHTDAYRALAEGNRVNLQMLLPARGRLITVDGHILADGAPVYRAALNLLKWRKLEPRERASVLRVFSELSGRSEAELKRASRRAGIGRDGPVLTADNLSWEAFSRIGVNLYRLPGVGIDAGHKRTYPGGPAYTHIVGYVAPPAPAERDTGDDALLKLPDMRIGRSGVEKMADPFLRGTPGLLRLEVDSAGRRVRELESRPPTPSDPCVLTVDSRLQQLATDLFGNDTGAASLIDLRDGALRVALSLPGFDARLFVDGITPADWQQLREGPAKPLFNRWSAGVYPPGSIFKPVTAIAALAGGHVHPDETVNCPGYFELGDRKFHCWKRTGHGPLNLAEALQHSCDVYFYRAALRTGPDAIAEAARACGLGAPSGSGFPGERSGTMPDSALILRRVRRSPTPGDALNMGIGQGLLGITPLQAVVLAAALAGGDDRPVPRLLTTQPVERVRNVAVPPEVRAGMIAVCNDPTGTAYASRLDPLRDGLDMAGKTGTAQVRRIGTAERLSGVIDNAHLPMRLRDHAWFIAYAPTEHPRFAAAVLVEHGGSGSGRAAPIARDLLRAAAQLYKA